jgi:hypothetical protein
MSHILLSIISLVLSTTITDVSAITVEIKNPAFTPISISTQSLPRSFRGTFTWRKKAPDFANVSLKITGATLARDKRTMRIRGHSIYNGEERTSFTGTINTATRQVTLKEHTKPNERFVTDGSFEGTISNDLQTISCIWTTKSTGEKGDLLLEAVQRTRR